MALTLTEANKYSTTTLQKVFVDRLVKQSRLLQLLPFIEVPGNSFTYNTWTTRSTAQWYSVGDTWSEGTGALTQATATLKVLGGDADIDEFTRRTRSNQTDLKGEVLAEKMTAVKETFADTFFYGVNSSNFKQPDGLQTLMSSTTYNTVHAGSGTGSVLSIAKLRAANDLIIGDTGKPKYVFMTKAIRTGIAVYLDSIGAAFPRSVNDWGKPIETWDGAEIVTDDNISNVELAASGAWVTGAGSDTTIFILTFDAEACCGLMGGGMKLPEIVPLGNLESKDAERFRIKWYCGLMLKSLRSCAKVDGITAAGTVTA
jgi:hypothetical protein